jgi:hypothetical protein
VLQARELTKFIFFLKKNSYMTCSQIWLIPLVDGGHVATLQKIK